MINPFQDVKWSPDLAERRKFARSLVIGFPVLAVVFLLMGWLRGGAWDHSLRVSLWLAGAGASAGLLFLAVPQIARPFYLAWYFLACCIGLVMGNLLLGAFYFLAVTLFGLVRRLANPKAFPKGFDKSAATYWHDAGPPPPPGRYYKQF